MHLKNINTCVFNAFKKKCIYLYITTVDLRVELTGGGGVEVVELQNDTTHITTQEGVTTLHKLQSRRLCYTTQHGALRLTGKLLASLEARGDRLVRRGGGETSL